MSKTQDFITYVRDACADASVGYSQLRRWRNPDVDCSSLMLLALNFAYGTTYSTGYTGTMRAQFEAAGWTWHVWDGNWGPVPVGAVMLNETYHTECVVDDYHFGGAHIDEAGDIVGTSGGDQTGGEVSIVDLYEYWAGWDGWLAPPADGAQVETPQPTPMPIGIKDTDTLAKEVLAGLWGNNPERAERLKRAGHDYAAIQQRVNEIVANGNTNAGKVAPAPDLDPVAWEVIRGAYGNGSVRTSALTAAGHDAEAVQQRVNELLA